MERDSPVKLAKQHSQDCASPTKTKEPKVGGLASAPLFVDVPIISLLQTLKFQESADSEFLVTVPSQYEANSTLQFGDVPSLKLQLNANDFSGTVDNRNNSSNPPSTIYLAKNPQSELVEFVALNTYFDGVSAYDYEINY